MIRRNLLPLFLAVAVCLPPALCWAANPDSGLYSNDEASWVQFGLGYQGDSGGMTTYGHGGFLELGLNPGKFIHRNLIAAPFVGLAMAGGNAAYSSEFLQAVNQHYRVPQRYLDLNAQPFLSETELEEMRGYQVGLNRMEKIRTQAPEGGMNLYYGLILRYPHRYAPAVKLYSTWNTTDLGSASTGLYEIGSGAVTKSQLMDRFGWGLEVFVFNGYSLSVGEDGGNLNLGFVSLFFESLDFRNARLHFRESDTEPPDVYFRDFVDPAFFDKYGREYKFGLKVGLYWL